MAVASLALAAAAESGDVAAARAALDAGADAAFTNKARPARGSGGRALPLSLPAAALTRGAPQHGYPPLRVAAGNGHAGIVALLLDCGSDVDVKDFVRRAALARSALAAAAEQPPSPRSNHMAALFAGLTCRFTGTGAEWIHCAANRCRE